jgi:malonyl-CoA/methylmalonyl-CoA synthetase
MPIELIRRAHNYLDRTAVLDSCGTHSYNSLLDNSHAVAASLLDNHDDLHEERVAFLTPPGADYVQVQWGIWRAGGIAVPLCSQHPPAEIEYVLQDCGVSRIVTHPVFREKLEPIAASLDIPLLITESIHGGNDLILPRVNLERGAMILYTSGTTSRPKGVVSTHLNIRSQIEGLVDAWKWSGDDHILHVLPLHHIHGIINVLCCSLWSGATCEMPSRFDAQTVFDVFLNGHCNLFMAVPTIYSKLIKAWEQLSPGEQQDVTSACSKMRLMVSGSAALPVKVLERWKRISGHTLLERYGMTEIGMALSNPYNAERRAGCVGLPLPGIEVCLVDEKEKVVTDEDCAGEIRVRGGNVFREYWNRSDATREVFRDGWFCTGDIAVLDRGYYRILGRSSVDIIKSGGYKISALEIEEVLRSHPDISDCAVVGIDDETWGEVVCAALVMKEGCSIKTSELRGWAGGRLARYKLPTKIRVQGELPRNAMGKVTKPDVKKLF